MSQEHASLGPLNQICNVVPTCANLDSEWKRVEKKRHTRTQPPPTTKGRYQYCRLPTMQNEGNPWDALRSMRSRR
jgi:hypothetical protein